MISHAREMRVVGERIETSGQLERLGDLGHHFSRPLPERDMEELRAKNPRYH